MKKTSDGPRQLGNGCFLLRTGLRCSSAESIQMITFLNYAVSLKLSGYAVLCRQTILDRAAPAYEML